ncbi:hypothetical protein KOR34_22090 [Posidoniimonas corsicana]|uniref:DUF1559 domain-containing protein n=1 Tax=Posidoniimonas corsicana TaxID=1938618 RepID=A0A5C5VHV5_9BACT|nr:DUF1559 domain-containing protein [Posidoniimonas corsicana]TWT37262.1 hypothetical protein KOR34_22090 [Posidoniimonas corsicana]
MKFSLTALLWLFALTAVGMGTFGAIGGLAVVALVVLTWVRSGWRATSGCLAFGAVGLTGFSMLAIVFSVADDALDREPCIHNNRRIMVAIHNYHDKHGALPPAWTVDADGRPLHSWRVLILPFVGEEELYQQFRLDEPWDSPHNQQLADQMPAVFRCQACEECRGAWGVPWDLPPRNCPSYHLVADPDAAFHRTSGATLAATTDRRNETIVLVESHERTKNWLEPDAYSLEEAVELLTSIDAVRHPNQTDCFWTTAYAGGRGYVSFLSGDYWNLGSMSEESARACLTAAGGEPRAGELLRIKAARAPSKHVVRWDRVALMLAFVTIALAPMWERRRSANTANEPQP